jgi:hypothetical protein
MKDPTLNDDGILGAERDHGTEGAEYDEAYFRSHLGQPYRWDNPVWLRFFGDVADYIVATLAPSTVLDAGCGVGFLVGALRERGVDAYGIDISSYAISQVPPELAPYCHRASVTDPLDARYDLICCIEILEHLQHDDAERAVDNFTTHTDRILFSSTPEDVVEPTHVNVRTPGDWVHMFARHSFVPRPLSGSTVVSAQAIVFETADSTSPTELAEQYETVRYRLAKETVELRSSLADARRETSAAVAAAAAEVATVRAAAAKQLAAVESRAALAVADAEQRAATADGDLQTILDTTWWRIGRPVRGALTAARLNRRDVSIAGTEAKLVRLIKPLVPLRARRFLRERIDSSLAAVSGSAEAQSVDEALAAAQPLLRPLRFFPSPERSGRRLTMVTDSLNAGSLFGGVGTSIILSTMLAERLGASLRVATRRERPNPTNFQTVLRAQGLAWDRRIEFAYAPLDGSSSLPLAADDLFLTTSWWSTWAALRSLDPGQIVYLLQEDERLFYPAGDEQVACTTVLSDERIRFVVNSELLFDHLVSSGLENIGRRGVAFEPAFPGSIYFHEPREATAPRTFFFYARPSNSRNLFLHGIEAVNEAIASGILAPGDWELWFVGSGIPDVVLEGGVRPNIAQNLPWPEYAGLIRRVDVGLSLMSTPHPSYPPLDLAACGAVAVTNRFGRKKSLERYSRNIVCTDLDRASIVAGIAEAIALADDESRRLTNFENQGLARDWRASFEHVLDELGSAL